MQLGTNGFRQRRSRRLFDHLLVATLQRAIPVTEGHHAARTVAEDLNLDVAGVVDEAFDEHAGRTEATGGQPGHPVECRPQFAVVAAHLHADAAAAAGRLQHHGVADLGRRRTRRPGVVEQLRSREHGNSGGAGRSPCRVLGAEDAQLVWGRPDEGHSRRLDRRCEIGVLGKESVAGVNHVDARRGRGGHQRVDAEVAFAGRRGTQPDGFVGEAHVGAPRSASENTATVRRPSSLAERTRRTAISPRLAIRTLSVTPPHPAG